ncbi:MAG: hypothetical protein N2258_02035 [Brevinematales bacterium]|nr:hypothetical protein [Brevinematales bacterium]
MSGLSVFEIIMLICFGFAWPFSIVKSYRSRSTKGKSAIFLFIILVGYVSGIIHKLFYSRDIVILFYVLNFLMVLIDLAIFFRNKMLEKLNI